MHQLLDRVGKITPLRPDWSRPVEVEYAFRTAVWTSYNGTEHREALRQRARVTLQYRTVMSAAVAQRQLADMAENQNADLTFVHTRWERTTLAATASAGATTLTVDDAPYWLVDGAWLTLSDGTIEEVRQVSAVSGTAVTLANALTVEFAAGSRVARTYPARVNGEFRATARTGNLWESSIRWDVDPGSDPQPYEPVPPNTYKGEELFLRKPNWTTPLQRGFAVETDTIDAGRGVIAVSAPHLSGVLTTRMLFSGLSAEDSRALVDVFLRQKGRRGAFYTPTWQHDLVPAETAPAGSTTLKIAGPDFYAAYEGSLAYNTVFVGSPSGVHQANRIVGMALDGDMNTVVSFEDAWLISLRPTSRISWCPLSRFATDVLRVRWHTDTIAETEFTIQAVQNG